MPNNKTYCLGSLTNQEYRTKTSAKEMLHLAMKANAKKIAMILPLQRG